MLCQSTMKTQPLVPPTVMKFILRKVHPCLLEDWVFTFIFFPDIILRFLSENLKETSVGDYFSIHIIDSLHTVSISFWDYNIITVFLPSFPSPFSFKFMSVSWLNGKELTKQETFPLLFQINPTALISFNLSKILPLFKINLHYTCN